MKETNRGEEKENKVEKKTDPSKRGQKKKHAIQE